MSEMTYSHEKQCTGVRISYVIQLSDLEPKICHQLVLNHIYGFGCQIHRDSILCSSATNSINLLSLPPNSFHLKMLICTSFRWASYRSV